MKKVLASLVLVSFLAAPMVVSAGWWEDLFGAGGQPEEAPTADIMLTLDRITNWLFAILLLIAAIFIIVAAFYFVTASGDPDKTKKARDFVLYAMIGVLVAFAAKGLVILVSRMVYTVPAP